MFRGLYYALRVTSNPKDLLSFENLIALIVPVGQADREVWRDRSVADCLTELANEAGISFDAAAALDPNCASDALDAALKPLTSLSPANKAPDETERLVRDAAALNDRWRSFCRAAAEDERTLSTFLNHLSLAGRASLSDPGIRVLTIHAVKGLEFRAVFLVGMNEGTFPDYRSVNNPSAVEDERRNAYVAVTRASRYLQLSRPRIRTMPWGDVRIQAPSRFLAELGL